MIAAFTTSSLFLICYLVYHAQVGSVRFTRQGFVRPLYFTILITHVTLAAAVLPLAIVTLSRGLKARYAQHRAIARWTLPDLAVRVGDRRAGLRPAVPADLAALNSASPEVSGPSRPSDTAVDARLGTEALATGYSRR